VTEPTGFDTWLTGGGTRALAELKTLGGTLMIWVVVVVVVVVVVEVVVVGRGGGGPTEEADIFVVASEMTNDVAADIVVVVSEVTNDVACPSWVNVTVTVFVTQ
jgi:hypothetical protein